MVLPKDNNVRLMGTAIVLVSDSGTFFLVDVGFEGATADGSYWVLYIYWRLARVK